MDRRSIIFIIGMTAIFFLFNQWLYYGKATATVLPEPKTAIEFTGKGSPRQLSQKEWNQYNVVKLYRDIELKQLLCLAIAQDTNYLTLSGQNTDFPDIAYTKAQPGSSVTSRLDLRVAPKGEGDPVLYSIYPLAKLVIPWIPDEGTYTVKMLYFDQENAYVVDGKTFAVEKAVFDVQPPQNALVLFEFQGNDSAYGYYEVKSNHMRYFNDVLEFENFAIMTFPTEKLMQSLETDEKYFVLENDYVQFVFSNFNGSLAEINFPFESKENQKSVVREIEFDRIMQKDYSYNDTFPQLPAQTFDGKTIQPHRGGYYPLLRRNIIGIAGDSSTQINPHYYATTIFDRDRFPILNEYKVTRFEKGLIEFQFSDDHHKITKTFSLPEDIEDAPYCINLSVVINGDARNLVMGMGVPEVELISNSFSPTLKYRIQGKYPPKMEQVKPPKSQLELGYVNADWFCNGNGFFGVILDPLEHKTPGLTINPIAGELVPTRISIIDAVNQRYPAEKFPGYAMLAPVMAKPGQTDYRIFAGPFDKSILKRIDQTFTDPITGYSPYYQGAHSYHGWFAFISQPFAKFLFIIMDFFHSITGSWGLSIIFLTIVLRLMLFPLNNWSMKSIAKTQKIAPKLKEVQEKYKKDPKRMQMETMSLYRREKANPFGGCFPILIQLPFLFGMFDLLKSSFVLRGATFIPGWIDNLTAPDVLFSWSYPIPLIGTSFHLLPLILGGIMFLQQKIIAGKKGSMTDEQRKQQAIGTIMPIFLTVLFYNFPSGLNIYWIFSTLLGILQQWYINKRVK